MRTYILLLSVLLFVGRTPAELQTQKQSSSIHSQLKSSERTWAKGLLLLDSGFISSGLLILDSIAQSDPTNHTSIAEFTNKAITLFSLRNNNDSVRSDLLLSRRSLIDTLQSNSFRATIVSQQLNSGKRLPSFKYTTLFNVEKPVQFVFKGLVDIPKPMLTMKRDILYTELEPRLIDQLNYKSDSISCFIFIDFNASLSTVDNYLKDRFSGVFDSICITKDLDKYNALSLRGYNRKNWSIENGQFTAVISFDKILPDRKIVKGKVHTAPLPLRYTVVIQSPGSIRELAEAKLQSLLKLL